MTWTFHSHAHKCKIKCTNRAPRSASSSYESISHEACVILIKQLWKHLTWSVCNINKALIVISVLKCLVAGLGLNPLGEDTGTADALALLILQSNITLSDHVQILITRVFVNAVLCSTQERVTRFCRCSFPAAPSNEKFCRPRSETTVSTFIISIMC